MAGSFRMAVNLLQSVIESGAQHGLDADHTVIHRHAFTDKIHCGFYGYGRTFFCMGAGAHTVGHRPHKPAVFQLADIVGILAGLVLLKV